MSNNIQGKAIVITDVDSGLGEATGRLLSAQRTSRCLQSLADELIANCGKAVGVQTRVAHYNQVRTRR